MLSKFFEGRGIVRGWFKFFEVSLKTDEIPLDQDKRAQPRKIVLRALRTKEIVIFSVGVHFQSLIPAAKLAHPPPPKEDVTEIPLDFEKRTTAGY